VGRITGDGRLAPRRERDRVQAPSVNDVERGWKDRQAVGRREKDDHENERL
jgi:hypothetical protein